MIGPAEITTVPADLPLQGWSWLLYCLFTYKCEEQMHLFVYGLVKSEIHNLHWIWCFHSHIMYVCLVTKYRAVVFSRTEQLQNDHCLMLSVGEKGGWTFLVSIVQEKTTESTK